MFTFVLTLALTCFFPIFDIGSAEYSGLAIANPSTQAVDFTVTATSADGSNIQRGLLSLPPGAQRARLLTEIVGPPVLKSGWVRIDSTASGCIMYMTAGSAEALAGADAASSLSASLILPHVDVNTGFMELNHTDTDIAVVNPSDTAATVNAQLVGLDGVTRASVSMTVPLRGSRVIRVSETFREFLPANTAGGKTFQGYVRLTSDIGIAAWQRVETPLSRSLLRGIAIQEIQPATTAMLPHFAWGGPGLYRSIVNIINPTNATIELELSGHNDTGNVIGDAVRFSLAPGEARRGDVASLFRFIVPAIFPPPLISGYIRIREIQGRAFPIIGSVEISSAAGAGRVSASMHPISDTAATRWILPFAPGAPYFTGYAIANPNELLTVQTDVTVELWSSDGTLIRSLETISLAPRGRKASLVPDNLSGYLVIRSSLPIHVSGAIGTYDGAVLDQLPALR